MLTERTKGVKTTRISSARVRSDFTELLAKCSTYVNPTINHPYYLSSVPTNEKPWVQGFTEIETNNALLFRDSEVSFANYAIGVADKIETQIVAHPAFKRADFIARKRGIVASEPGTCSPSRVQSTRDPFRDNYAPRTLLEYT